jgi:hypothetical protein
LALSTSENQCTCCLPSNNNKLASTKRSKKKVGTSKSSFMYPRTKLPRRLVVAVAVFFFL